MKKKKTEPSKLKVTFEDLKNDPLLTSHREKMRKEIEIKNREENLVDEVYRLNSLQKKYDRMRERAKKRKQSGFKFKNKEQELDFLNFKKYIPPKINNTSNLIDRSRNQNTSNLIHSIIPLDYVPSRRSSTTGVDFDNIKDDKLRLIRKVYEDNYRGSQIFMDSVLNTRRTTTVRVKKFKSRTKNALNQMCSFHGIDDNFVYQPDFKVQSSSQPIEEL